MDDIPEVYELETIEQMRVAADALRQRIVHPLTHRRMTVTQVGELLGIAPAKVHYHMRELERVGLVRMVETREKGGILEKYYQAAGRSITVSPSLVEKMSSDESIAAMSEFFQGVSREFLEAVGRRGRVVGEVGPLTLSRTQLWANDAEATALMEQVGALFEPYSEPRGVPRERERTFVAVEYDSAPAHANGAAPEPKRRRHSLMAGIMVCERAGLEKAVARNEVFDIAVYGICSFANDITADLADRAIGSFRHRGVLRASDEVREVLLRKESAAER